MSTKQFLLAAALASTFLVQSASSQVTCKGVLDTECCTNKDKELCSFEMFGVDFIGICYYQEAGFLDQNNPEIAVSPSSSHIGIE
jgi:hypothetical protein